MRHYLEMFGICLLLVGCHGHDEGGHSTVGHDQPALGTDVIDNMLGADLNAGPRDYGQFEPTLKPSHASSANSLSKPAAYRRAIFGYFDDADVISQLSAKELARMRIDGNAFHAQADLDRDGAMETYRTGYFRMPDGATGLFLVGFERHRQIGLWVEPDPLWSILWISVRDGVSLWHCNCPETGRVSLVQGRLSVKWKS